MTPLDARHLMESTEHLAVEINHFVNMVKAPLTDVDQGQLNKIEAESKSLVAFVNGITAPETVQAHDARVDQERRTGHNIPPAANPDAPAPKAQPAPARFNPPFGQDPRKK